MLDKFVARFSSPDELLRLSQTQLDGILLSYIAGRANNGHPIAASSSTKTRSSGSIPSGLGRHFNRGRPSTTPLWIPGSVSNRAV